MTAGFMRTTASPNRLICASLASTLQAAISSLADGNDDTAVNQLSAFINQVEAQAEGKISGDTADALITAARAIISAVETGP